MAVRFQAGTLFFFFLRRLVLDCRFGLGLGAGWSGGFGAESGSIGVRLHLIRGWRLHG
jgi:hypothetical protein